MQVAHTQKHNIQILPASAKYARRLFREWVNLPSPLNNAWLRWFRKRHPAVFDFLPESDEQAFRDLVTRIAGVLFYAWRERDEYKRDWYLFKARYHYEESRMKYMSSRLALLVTPFEEVKGPGSFWDTHGITQTPFHTSMHILQTRLVRKMRVCRADHCVGFRYFFEKRRNQKYCGTDCSEPATRESKRRWKMENPK